MDAVLVGAIIWLGASLLTAVAWSRFFAGMDTLPDPADAAPAPVHTATDWTAEYRRALEAEVPGESSASQASA